MDIDPKREGRVGMSKLVSHPPYTLPRCQGAELTKFGKLVASGQPFRFRTAAGR